MSAFVEVRERRPLQPHRPWLGGKVALLLTHILDSLEYPLSVPLPLSLPNGFYMSFVQTAHKLAALSLEIVRACAWFGPCKSAVFTSLEISPEMQVINLFFLSERAQSANL